MKQVAISLDVAQAAQRSSAFLKDKGFSIFAEIDHSANAVGVELELPPARAIIFGNPLAGTKLMQRDINMSLELPLRLAIVERDDGVYLLHPSAEDFSARCDVEGHPVLEKIDGLFAALAETLSNG